MKFQISTPKAPLPVEGLGGVCLGHAYAVTDQFITRDGKPYLYRMGELHFSRVPEGDWERELLRMKAGGIEIVSSYLIWIHHEEEEGNLIFEGNCNVRRFCEICRKVDMPFFLRIGPWAHGEVRNGGFPDWLIQKCGGMQNMRRNQRPYLDYVERFFARIHEELKDMNDVILGIQVENELCNRPDHIAYLKSYLLELGFDPPLWSATAWGGGGASKNLPKDGILPMYGGYPEAPWDPSLTVKYDHDSFFFRDERGSAGIGNDLLGSYELSDKDHRYPYLTCELGGGNQVTYHRRPIISALDILSATVCMLGSGVSGLGYYMYHGGKNPIGKHSTMQETRAVGDLNDYACVSYDFQSPLGDCGQVRESYYRLRSIFDFVECFGESLASMPAVMPLERPKDAFDLETPRASVRSDGKSGFLFVNNHTHGAKLRPRDEEISVSFADGKTLGLSLHLDSDAVGILPLRFPIGRIVADYITAMPVSVTESEIVFEANDGIKPEVCTEDGKILALTDGMELGGVRLRMREKTLPMMATRVPVRIKRTSEKIMADAFSHIQNRDGTPCAKVETAAYELYPPKDCAYLIVDAIGNAGAIYQNGMLFDDFYFLGDEWFIDLRERTATSPLLLEILPLDERDKEKIYFETEMPCGIYEPRVWAVTEEDLTKHRVI